MTTQDLISLTIGMGIGYVIVPWLISVAFDYLENRKGRQQRERRQP